MFNAVHILILQLLHHARCAPSLEDLLAKTKERNSSVLAPSPSATRVKETVKIHWVFFFFFPSLALSFYIKGAKEIIDHSMKDLVTQVCGISPLKHHWRKASAQPREALSRLVRLIFTSHAKVMFLLQSLQMTAHNQTEGIFKPNFSSSHFILSTKRFPQVSTSMSPGVLPTRHHIVLPLEYKLLHSVLVLALCINEVLALTLLHPFLTWE